MVAQMQSAAKDDVNTHRLASEAGATKKKDPFNIIGAVRYFPKPTKDDVAHLVHRLRFTLMR